jgi:hypothetical protein
MNGQRPPLFTPALIGGTAAGVASVIPGLNCLCCLWIIGGAALSAVLWSKNSPVRLTPGDGALVGAFSGVIAAGVNALIGIPLTRVNAAFFRRLFERLSEYAEMPAGWERWFSPEGPFSLTWFLVGLAIASVVFAVFGALGGAIGLSLFGPKTPPIPPPQPPLPPPVP